MRQMAEEHELLKTHISQLFDLLKELMEDAQDLQLKELELRQEKYEKYLYYCSDITVSCHLRRPNVSYCGGGSLLWCIPQRSSLFVVRHTSGHLITPDCNVNVM